MPTHRQVNRSIGKSPSLGGIPLSLAIPALIAFAVTALFQLVIGFSWLTMFLIASWLTGTWWVASGGNNFRFFSRFSGWFLPRWRRGALKYLPITDAEKGE